MNHMRLLMASALVCHNAMAQSTQPAISPPGGHLPVPDHALYFILFDHISKQD